MEDRAEILRACRYVDQVIEDVPICVPRELIEEYEIDIVAHGEDMTKYLKDVAYKVPIDMGIMRTFPYHDGISTTQIIEMIKER